MVTSIIANHNPYFELEYETEHKERKSEVIYLKTHSGEAQNRSQNKSDMEYKEMLVFKPFELLSMGPEAHFFNNLDTKDFFIATKSFGKGFYTLPELVFNFNCEKRIFKKFT